STAYTYTLYAQDWHGNYSTGTPITVTTPPAGAIDPRRVGLRPTGSYWGAAGEQIDTLSGNLNFTMPLFKAMGRGGWGVNFALSYNSQLWRLDGGGTWRLGRDDGYGLGWRLMAGSVTPYWNGYYSLDHFIFADATGAEYRLDINANGAGVWTSSEGIYVSYDSNTKRLYFPDGTFWVMGCTSWGWEQDAGTLYPTQMQDTNGNLINVRYGAAVALAGTSNTSSRITEVEDVRAVLDNSTGRYRTYSFTYNADSLPHLTGIANYVGTAENYTLTPVNEAIQSPFSPPVADGTQTLLASVAVNGLGLTESFQYDGGVAPGAGELTQVTLPTGGHLRWAYRSFTFNGSRTQREVQTRYLAQGSNGSTETAHSFSHNDGTDAGLSFHSSTTLDGPNNAGEKYWAFSTDGAFPWRLGLVSSFEERPSASQSNSPLRRQDYTWTQDSVSNPYIGTLLTTLDPTGANVQTKTTQTLDTHGNVTTTNIYDYGNLSTPARTYTNTYLTSSNYTSRYIFNRLSTSAVTGLAVNLVSNTYDVGTLTNVTGQREHDDTNYGTGFSYRGNVTTTTVPGAVVNHTYDIDGNEVSRNDGQGHTLAITTDSSKNYAVPATLTPNSNNNLASSMAYTSFLGLQQLTVPNGAFSKTTYDTYGRVATTTSIHGEVVTYAYTYNPSVVTGTVTTGTVTGQWTRTTMDGLGRPIKVETGDASSTKSVVDTVYGPCACSPMGKVTQVSQPYVPGAVNIFQTAYAYDGLGRTSTVTLPGATPSTSSGTTTYAYAGNTTTITDPAGKWKKQTMDVFGNLTQVNEPNPATGADYVTSYTYDLLNHLHTVSMTRSTGSQTRTFNYDSTTQRLMSEVHPESGTTSYTYNADGTLASKTVPHPTDSAKHQKITYTYDSLQRIQTIQRYPDSAGAPDPCQTANFAWDVNLIANDPGTYPWFFTPYAFGRLGGIQWGFQDPNINFSPTTPCNTGGFTELYNYNVDGTVSFKRLQYSQYTQATNSVLIGDLDAQYGYDSRGNILGIIYPNEWPANPPYDPSRGPAFYTFYRHLYSEDSMGRPSTLVMQTCPSAVCGSGGATEMNNVVYGPANEMTSIGGETRTYNSRLQLTRQTTSGLDLEYVYSATANNGQITQMINHVANETVNYTYDTLARLSTATSAQWSLTYAYDGFGNRTTQTGTGTAPSATFNYNGNNNQITTAGFSYDLKGNMTQIPVTGGLSYDVENRLGGASGTVSYSQDNKRVWDGQFVHFFGIDGRELGVYQPSYNQVQGVSIWTFGTIGQDEYFNGKMFLAKGQPVVTDRLGSVRYRRGVASSYYPYGEEYTTTAQSQVKFATYYRDTSGLDYADQRFYRSIHGGFLTPDPAMNSADPADPGSWNRYAYTRGDPVNRYDPSGLTCVATDGFWVDNGDSFGCSENGQPTGDLTNLINNPTFVTNVWGVLDTTNQMAQGDPSECTVSQLIMMECDSSQVIAAVGGRSWWAAYGVGTWSAAVRLIGYAGEAVVSKMLGLARNVGPGRFTVPNGNSFVIPDFVDQATSTIYEVKNVTGPGVTGQLTAMASWAQQNGWKFVLYLNSNSEGNLSNNFVNWANKYGVRIQYFDWP
ncbi:MAG TPA: RHS repeat-associated core domain-containing protein, partial [Bryobacteraceae bacterium]|nr:RHS repeat-associated core domain-containing protein [Bryobacteraceae bacterium]